MRTIQNTTSARLNRAYSGQKVRADVVLGSPSANCSGVGICRVMARKGEGEISCPTVNSWISITTDGKLRFEFEKNSMEGRYMRRHFRWLLFQVIEEYVVPRPVLGPLKFKERTIKPGIYQVWEVDGWFIVEF
ncbi:MAG: hypothetical protein EP344_00545 [Bacteroidetes bacterium]|nr:MAG: hypothetical protein EP344_00545 [Bacteroidota bacterium]